MCYCMCLQNLDKFPVVTFCISMYFQMDNKTKVIKLQITNTKL